MFIFFSGHTTDWYTMDTTNLESAIYLAQANIECQGVIFYQPFTYVKARLFYEPHK